MKIALTFYPNLNKKNKKTGKIPIYLRLCHQNRKAESRLNAEIPEKELSLWNTHVMRIDSKKSAVNDQLNAIEQELQKFLIFNGPRLSDFNTVEIREHILGKKFPATIAVSEYIERYYMHSILLNAKLSIGTQKNYRKAINHLKKFIVSNDLTAISLNGINNTFALKFKDYLLIPNPGLRMIGMTQASASGIIKKFKTIFDRAVMEGLLARNPFRILKLKNDSPKRERLNVNQVKSLMALNLAQNPNQVVYRDIFLFSVFTGLAYTDAMSLKWANLTDLHNHEILLRICRRKTDAVTELVLVSFAKNIVEKYKNSPICFSEAAVLPKRSNKELNLYLKILADKAGINIKLTSHIGRHTFRQLLGEAGIEDPRVIKRMMGQSRKSDIDEIYYFVTESRLLEGKNKFELYLNSNLL